jgi:hypothetical protein
MKKKPCCNRRRADKLIRPLALVIGASAVSGLVAVVNMAGGLGLSWSIVLCPLWLVGLAMALTWLVLGLFMALVWAASEILTRVGR